MIFKNLFNKKSDEHELRNIPENIVVSPIKGKRIEFESIDDFVFSKGLMGKGVAILPSSGEIYSPVSGKVIVSAHTKHAIGIITDTGIEVLVHIGYKTELLNGKEFTTYHSVGQRVNAGEKLVSFKYDEMIKRDFDLTTMVIVTNTNDYSDIVTVDSKDINVGDKIIEVKN